VKIHHVISLFTLSITAVFFLKPVSVRAELTASERQMIDQCRAGDRNQCWKAADFISSRYPEKREAEIRGCDLGNRDLYYSAGISFERDVNAPDRLNRAVKYFKLACELGNSDGCTRLGSNQGASGTAAAANLLQTNKNRCNSGDGVACNMAGYLLDNSSSGPNDKSDVLYFYNRGCKLGNKTACSNGNTIQANLSFARRNADRKTAELAARNDLSRRPGSDLNQADRACLQNQQESYYTSEKGQCISYYTGPRGSEGCAKYELISVEWTRYNVKNICARSISINEYCGRTSFASATLLPGDIYTRRFVSPCRLTN
jgi:hypothetical protein